MLTKSQSPNNRQIIILTAQHMHYILLALNCGNLALLSLLDLLAAFNMVDHDMLLRRL